MRVGALFTPSGALALRYVLEADPARLRIPAAGPASRQERLWRHTCFEAFIQGEDAPAYLEYNFSPSGQWQVYAMTDYRQGAPLQAVPTPSLERLDTPGQLALSCVLPRAGLPPGNPLRLGLTAVIEAVDGGLSYWALCHPSDKPDFHHTRAFVLTLHRP